MKTINIIIEGIQSHYFAKLRPRLNQLKQINQKGKLLPGSANRNEITCHYPTANVKVFDNWLIRDNKQLDTSRTKQVNISNDNGLTKFN